MGDHVGMCGAQLTRAGFGVHISFVRSITMDKWSEDQLKKMKVGRGLGRARRIQVAALADG
jgi:hypothetical protein